jgi:hypothetical protein
MVITAIHLHWKQKRQLMRRARKTRSTVSQELRDAVDLYLSISVKEQKQLELCARAANKSAGRMIKKLDAAIAYTDRALSSLGKTKRVGGER